MLRPLCNKFGKIYREVLYDVKATLALEHASGNWYIMNSVKTKIR